MNAGQYGAPVVAFRILVEHKPGDAPTVDDVLSALQDHLQQACVIEVEHGASPCSEFGHLQGDSCPRCKENPERPIDHVAWPKGGICIAHGREHTRSHFAYSGCRRDGSGVVGPACGDVAQGKFPEFADLGFFDLGRTKPWGGHGREAKT